MRQLAEQRTCSEKRSKLGGGWCKLIARHNQPLLALFAKTELHAYFLVFLSLFLSSLPLPLLTSKGVKSFA